MDIYENVIIGNFLFGLGAALGAKAQAGGTPPLAINLLQQTPMDRTVGDVLVQGSRAFCILEFKRTANSSTKEVTKKRVLSGVLNTPENLELMDLSRQVHLYVESQYREQGLSIRIRPYLDLEDNTVTGSSLQKLISDIADEASSSGPPLSNAYERYLELLAFCASKQSGGSGALVVSVDETGKLHYAAVDNLLELGLHLDKWHQLYLQRHQSLTRQLEKELQIELNKTREMEGPEL